MPGIAHDEDIDTWLCGLEDPDIMSDDTLITNVHYGLSKKPPDKYGPALEHQLSFASGELRANVPLSYNPVGQVLHLVKDTKMSQTVQDLLATSIGHFCFARPLLVIPIFRNASAYHQSAPLGSTLAPAAWRAYDLVIGRSRPVTLKSQGDTMRRRRGDSGRKYQGEG
jgi:hypothetical protein